MPKAEYRSNCRLCILKNYNEWINRHIKLVIDSKVAEIIRNKILMPGFDPSVNTLIRIVKYMTKNSSVGKSQMVLATKLNYEVLTKHLEWMKKNGFVKSTIDDGNINIVLTTTGRYFAKIILDID